MIFHPAILALLVGSVLVTMMLFYSGFYGLRILRHWDITSGSERQLDLERRTYLISTIMTYALGFELLSLFLFIYTADHLAPLFVGAMCAAGSLKVNDWGYLTILLKVFNFLVAGIWLIVNYTDNRAFDYPLIKKKYFLLLVMIPFIAAETLIQGSYFLELEPDIITSCCGTLFTSDSEGAAGAILSLPQRPVEAAFYASLATTFLLGIFFYRSGKGAYLFSLSSLVAFIVCVTALISFISIYFYELPTHHCPFCILQREYGYVGYPLYLTFFVGAVAGLGMGVVTLFNNARSLEEVLPRIQRQLTLISLLAYGAFVLIVGYGIIFSNLRMSG